MGTVIDGQKFPKQRQIIELSSRKPTSYETELSDCCFLSLDAHSHFIQSVTKDLSGCQKVSVCATGQCLLDNCKQTDAVISKATVLIGHYFSLTTFTCLSSATNNDGGAVAQRVERWTCDQQVVGSIPAWSKAA